MPQDIQGLVGPRTKGDDEDSKLRFGNNAELIFSELHGKYFELARRGAVYHACTPAAGVTLPIFSNTAQTYALWNPPGSNVLAELIRLEIGYVSAADVPGNVVLASVPNVVAIATLSGTITVATIAQPLSGQWGGPGAASQCKLLSTITTVAPTFGRTVGLSEETAVAASTNALSWYGYNFDGTDVLYPSTALFVACNVAAGVGVAVVNLVFAEARIPPSGV